VPSKDGKAKAAKSKAASKAKKPADKAPPKLEPGFANPSDKVVVRAPWIPLVVRLPDGWDGATASLTLDGKPWVDSAAVLRPRGPLKGGGVDYIATLQTGDLADGEHTMGATFAKLGLTDLSYTTTFEQNGREHKVDVKVVDDKGKPLPARIRLFDGKGKRLAIGRRDIDTDPTRRDQVLHTLFAADGSTSVRLDPGKYKLVAYAGLRHDAEVQEIEISADQTLTFTLPQVIDTPGQLLADFNVHTAASRDSWVPVQMRAESLRSSGLDVGVVSDLDVVGKLETGGDPLVIQGTEISLHGKKRKDIGRLIVWPVGADADLTQLEGTPAVGQQLAHWRALSDNSVLTVSHPRGVQLKLDQDGLGSHTALWTNLRYDANKLMTHEANAPMLADHDGSNAVSYDAIEVGNRWSFDVYKRVRTDWFRQWNEGQGKTGLASADAHTLNLEHLGFPANLVTAASNADAIAKAVKQGNLSTTTGPIIDVSVAANGKGAGPGEMVSGAGAVAKIRVSAAPWIPVHEVRVIVNGTLAKKQVLEASRSEEALRLELEVPIEATADAWVVVEAGWPLTQPAKTGGVYREIAPGYVPYAFTNPIRLDVDGDGIWTPPGRDLDAEHKAAAKKRAQQSQKSKAQAYKNKAPGAAGKNAPPAPAPGMSPEIRAKIAERSKAKAKTKSKPQPQE
jgi:hypothetical protein